MLHGISSLQVKALSPLLMSIVNDNVEIVTALLKNGADANEISIDGWSPLHFAAQYGAKNCRDAVVTVLLSYGATVNHANNDGSTPLHFAAENDHDAAVAKFIEKGADVNQVDHDGDRPIDVAKTQKIKDMLVALTEEKRDDQGQAAGTKVVDEAQWFRAAKKGKLALIQKGINDKIDVNCRDSGGRTALYWSTFQGHLHLVEYLVKCHSDLNVMTVSANDVTCQYAIPSNQHLPVPLRAPSLTTLTVNACLIPFIAQ